MPDTDVLRMTSCTRPASICRLKAMSKSLSSCVETEPILSRLRSLRSGKLATSPQLLWQNLTHGDTMKSLVNYTGAFKLESCFKFVEVCINDIVHNTLQSDHISFRTSEMYVRGISFAKLSTKYSKLLSLLDRLNRERETRKNLGISHLNGWFGKVLSPAQWSWW